METKIQSKIKAVKEVKSYGHINLNSKDFPQVKDLKINTTIQVLVTLDINSLNSPARWEIAEGNSKPSDVRASGSITKVDFGKKEK